MLIQAVIWLNISVLKFGGTSVSTEEGREWAFRHISQHLAAGKGVAVVVSAMGRAGDAYSTDTLISLMGKFSVPYRDLDLLMSCGEIISTVVLSGFLRSKGVIAFPLTGSQAGILTDGEHGDSSIVDLRCERIAGIISSGQIPVVAGFQGISIDGEITTLGRGGSDMTAIALASALGAETVEIYKDVPGIMTGDPKENPNAVLLERMAADELLRITRNGSRVIHHKAVELAMKKGVSFQVRNNFSLDSGTMVYCDTAGTMDDDAPEPAIS